MNVLNLPQDIHISIEVLKLKQTRTEDVATLLHSSTGLGMTNAVHTHMLR
jgi:hypothetical protein